MLSLIVMALVWLTVLDCRFKEYFKICNLYENVGNLEKRVTILFQNFELILKYSQNLNLKITVCKCTCDHDVSGDAAEMRRIHIGNATESHHE